MSLTRRGQQDRSRVHGTSGPTHPKPPPTCRSAADPARMIAALPQRECRQALALPEKRPILITGRVRYYARRSSKQSPRIPALTGSAQDLPSSTRSFRRTYSGPIRKYDNIRPPIHGMVDRIAGASPTLRSTTSPAFDGTGPNNPPRSRPLRTGRLGNRIRHCICAALQGLLTVL